MKWTKGWGHGLTGPNTPSTPTVAESCHRYDWTHDKREDYPQPCDYYIPISVGQDTVAIAVGPDREQTANLISAAPEMLELLKYMASYVGSDFIRHRITKIIDKAEGRQ
jgi:hypothetical protein